ncbi:MAG: ELM1/GtrOC1 family putative glycosyltransferase [Candidatus Omnitrophica bacterium]|nr:ELM1/GtrOC1 family putative glycosyltransferase [Candidatus Omnitrophota bacterium]
MEKNSLAYYLEYCAVKAVAFLIGHLPITWSLRVSLVFGGLVHFFHKGKRIGYANLKAAFGDEMGPRERKRVIWKMYLHLAQTVAEVLYVPKMDMSYVLRYIAPDFWRLGEAIRRGRGVILLTAHLGSWELANVYSSIRGYPMTILVKNQKNPYLDKYLNSIREFHGSKTAGKTLRLREIVEALHNNDFLGYVGDQSGGPNGLLVDFFGRKTSVATGHFALAAKTGASVLPCFDIRLKGPHHELEIGERMNLIRTGNKENDLVANAKNFIRMLEERIRRRPEQWLWAHKRWKTTPVRHIVVLKDGKAGHESQSLALMRLFRELNGEISPAYEFRETEIDVRFRSGLKKKLFPYFAFLFYPFAQGRLSYLRWFFDAPSAKAIEKAYADIVISAGSSLVPLNLLMARESMAKKIVVMKPGFPFSLFKYDTAVIPEHDKPTAVRHALFTSVALNQVVKEKLDTEAVRIRNLIKGEVKPSISFFIGGDSKRFRLEKKTVHRAVDELVDAARAVNGDVLITTSRRTSSDIETSLKDRLRSESRCKLLVLANEKNIENVTYGMMGLSDWLVVTEDSISMISEAVSSGKKVVILHEEMNGLSRKHRAFQQDIAEKGLARIARPWQLRETIMKLRSVPSKTDTLDADRARIKQRLREIL